MAETEVTKYKLVPDTNGWNIAERRVAGENSKAVPEGTVSWVAIKFYGSLKQAATALLEYIIQDGWATDCDRDDLKRLIEAVQIAQNKIKEYVKETQCK